MPDTTEDLLWRIVTLEKEVARLRHVQSSAASLISSLDLDETLRTIVQTALNIVGSTQGSILLYNSARTHLRIVHAVGLSDEMIASTNIADGEGISGGVARTGEPVVVEDIEADPRFTERRSAVRRSRSFACLPLKYREQTLGVMNLSHPKEGFAFRTEHLPTLTALANQAAVAIAHAELHRSLMEKQRLEQHIEMAKAIHDSFVPPRLHASGNGYEFSGRNQTSRMVGGDFYGVVELSKGGYAFFLGDVSGKGIPAALYMARLLSDISHHIALDPAPDAVLAALNRELCKRSHRGMFVTMAYGTAETKHGEIRLALAGHPAPLLWKHDGPATTLQTAAAPPMGIRPECSFPSFRMTLEAGDLLFLYSDGVPEAAAPSGEQFGAERLLRAVEATSLHHHSHPVDSLLQQILEFSVEGALRDDVTLLATGLSR